jgi:hypothetical protein
VQQTPAGQPGRPGSDARNAVPPCAHQDAHHSQFRPNAEVLWGITREKRSFLIRREGVVGDALVWNFEGLGNRPDYPSGLLDMPGLFVQTFERVDFASAENHVRRFLFSLFSSSKWVLVARSTCCY